MASTERAVTKAETAAEKRFESVNEFRATLADQQRMLMPRNEVDVTIHAMSERIEAQSKVVKDQNERVIALAAAQHGQKEGQLSGWSYGVGVVGLILTVLSSGVRSWPEAIRAKDRGGSEERSPNPTAGGEGTSNLYGRPGRDVAAEPAVDIRPGSSGIDMVVRYVTRAGDRFGVRNRLYHQILGLLNKTADELEATRPQ